MTGAFIVLTAFVTAFLSGILGMAGGLVLMGALALVLPVSAAFVTHGILQLVANGWRAVVHRQYVDWTILRNYAVASFAAAALVSLVGYAPSRPMLFLLLGLVPMLVWLPRKWIQLDAAKMPHAMISGFMVTGLNLTAGVAGPLLDIFFVRTALTRHQIVATKAATQVFSHLAKILVYGAPLLAAHERGMPPLWVFVLAIPLSMVGTICGGWVLDRISDVNFKRYTALVVTAVGIGYLVKAAQAWM
ncbi:sulfite exporter TauE/SafE family protein [Sphingobium nicotianae]|uniref:Probable membrane transporter protein n=1 Tax=Sphingobium nicotianae TaxID=2782607 RepID=A0A9X1DAV2_9SPHN|nr:sulfite exporter TauE/SafE family protein [Sphingobium nicotianae]MBT2186593.1 TSUP family transporter [Sphingobium nicotianae]